MGLPGSTLYPHTGEPIGRTLEDDLAELRKLRKHEAERGRLRDTNEELLRACRLALSLLQSVVAPPMRCQEFLGTVRALEDAIRHAEAL